jgi:hypothetical protein
MIEINNKHTNIEGTNLELLRDTTILFHALLETSPELLIACFTAYNDELTASLLKSDTNVLRPLIGLTNTFRKSIKNSEIRKGDKTNE